MSLNITWEETYKRERERERERERDNYYNRIVQFLVVAVVTELLVRGRRGEGGFSGCFNTFFVKLTCKKSFIDEEICCDKRWFPFR